MKGLSALLSMPRGRDFLLSQDIHTDPVAFRAALVPPSDSRLAFACGADLGALVHMHQQIYLDHRPSVLDKVLVLDALADPGDGGRAAIHPTFFWIDTDRAASDKLACRFYWPFRGVLRAMKVTPPGSERLETRFTRVDPPRTEEAYQRIADYVRHDRDQTMLFSASEQLARLSSLRAQIVVSAPTSLGDYGLELTRALFRAQLGIIDRTHVVLSDILARGWLTAAIEEVLAVLPDFIVAYNARVTSLREQGVATAVGLLPPDYLPLHFSDPDDGARLRLHHEVCGTDHFACAVGSTGRAHHRFFLGTRRLRLDELTATGRWSPDVTLPMLANALFSGWVAGKSSALYALVFRNVLADVLGKRPIPVLVPDRVAGEADGLFDRLADRPATSLLHAYVTGAALAPQRHLATGSIP